MKLKHTLKHYTDTSIYQTIHRSYNSYETVQSTAVTGADFENIPRGDIKNGCISLERISITSFLSSLCQCCLYKQLVCLYNELTTPTTTKKKRQLHDGYRYEPFLNL